MCELCELPSSEIRIWEREAAAGAASLPRELFSFGGRMLLAEGLATGAGERVVALSCDGMRVVLLELADFLGVAEEASGVGMPLVVVNGSLIQLSQSSLRSRLPIVPRLHPGGGNAHWRIERWITCQAPCWRR